MTTTINASTSSGLVVTPDNSGNILLQYNGVAAPAFAAYGNAYQTVANSTYTKVAYNTKEFDTNNCYDTTNYRFTPNVAGYYQINALISFGTNATGAVFIRIYKNGSAYRDGGYVANANYGPEINVNAVCYANGTTDYFEIYMWQNSGGNLSGGSGSSLLSFNGCLLRGA